MRTSSLIPSTLAALALVATSAAARAGHPSQTPQAVALPNDAGSFKFAVLGSFGTGSRSQYELAADMAALRGRFDYKTVVLTGDNVYGSARPGDYVKKFEDPYKPLLAGGVNFYAALGDRDQSEQRYYKLFNMDGRVYYTFNPAVGVRFFVLDSTRPDREQFKWLERELASSQDPWKIVVSHHSLYSSAAGPRSDQRLRDMLEPLFVQHNVSVVFSGDDRVYERVKPQKGIAYFVVGAGGEVRTGSLKPSSGITASGFDSDLSFMAAEIVGDQMYFNVISRRGAIVDSGIVTRRGAPSLAERRP